MKNLNNAIIERTLEANAKLGEIYREGRRVYYIMLKTGKAKEGRRAELIRYLIRNKYV